MFDFGFWEILIIAVITLIVLGPKKMPTVAKKAGFFVGKANKIITNIKKDIKKYLDEEELKDSLNFEEEKSNSSKNLKKTKK